MRKLVSFSHPGLPLTQEPSPRSWERATSLSRMNSITLASLTVADSPAPRSRFFLTKTCLLWKEFFRKLKAIQARSWLSRSEERRVGKSVDLGVGRVIDRKISK